MDSKLIFDVVNGTTGVIAGVTVFLVASTARRIVQLFRMRREEVEQLKKSVLERAEAHAKAQAALEARNATFPAGELFDAIPKRLYGMKVEREAVSASHSQGVQHLMISITRKDSPGTTIIAAEAAHG